MATQIKTYEKIMPKGLVNSSKGGLGRAVVIAQISQATLQMRSDSRENKSEQPLALMRRYDKQLERLFGALSV